MSDFDPDALRPMIIASNGDVTSIANEIDADSEELRIFIMNTPVLRRAMEEVIHRGVDKTLRNMFRMLDDDEHPLNQLAAGKEFLKSRAAQRRGFHHAGDLELKMPAKGGALSITWLAPEDNRRPEPPLIEGKVENDG
jgi:hypothetical protein